MTAAVAHPADALRAAGFALCRPDPGGKNPTQRGWSARSLEAADFAPGDLVGILGGPLSDGNRPGHALVIVDLDAPAAVAQADAFLPATGMEDGRRGKSRSHRYYLMPLASIPDEARSAAEQAAAAAEQRCGHPGPKLRHFRHPETGANILDFIGTGGQVVCPPSLHPSGERREWAGGEPGEPAVVSYAELWGAVCRLAEACGWRVATPRPRPAPRAATGNGAARPEQVLRRATAYLAECKPAVSGRGGHAATMWAARCMVWGFDLGPDVGFQLLRDHYNPACEPPWSEAELWHKAEDADTVPFDRPRGWLLAEDRRQRNGRCERNGAAHPAVRAPDPAPTPPPEEAAADGLGVILADFRERYAPRFRRGTAVYSERLGREVAAREACFAPDRRLLAELAGAPNAPRDKHGCVDEGLLPAFFYRWCKSAWAELLGHLDDEEDSAEVLDAAGEEFRRRVAACLFAQATFAHVIDARSRETEQQRRTLLQWCALWAKAGGWQQVRSALLWCRRDPGGQLCVALRPELFGQYGPRELAAMPLRQFAKLCELYDVGTRSEGERPGGNRAVVLAPPFVQGLLLSGLPECLPEASGACAHAGAESRQPGNGGDNP